MKPAYALPCMAMLLIMASCSSPKTRNCAELGEMLDSVSSSTDSVLLDSSEWTRELEMDEISLADGPLPPEMLLSTGEQYSWAFRKGFNPLYFQLEQNAKTLRILNMEMSLYLKTLSEIESGAELSEKEFSRLSSAAKTAAAESAKSAKLPEIKEYSGLMSLATATLLDQYLRHRNSSIFADVVRSNQKSVENWAQLYGGILGTAAANIKGNYSRSALKLLAGDKISTKTAKRKQAESAFNLNDKLANSLDRLAEIEKAVSRVPAIHSRLPDKDSTLDDLMTELQIVLFQLESSDARRKK